MALLGDLRLFEGGGRRLEIAAGILPVRIEEQIVERQRDVVMMRRVAARGVQRIVLLQPAQQMAGLHAPIQPGGVMGALQIDGGEGQEIIEVALLHRQLAVHIGLADTQGRLQGQSPIEAGIVETDGDGPKALDGRPAEAVDASLGIDIGQAA